MMNKKGKRRNTRRRRQRRKALGMMLLGICLCIGIGVAAVKLVTMAFAEKAVIAIQAEPVTIRQEQEIPELKVSILLNGDEKTVLNRKSGYTVGDLVKEIKRGEHYRIENKADNIK